MYLKVCLFFKGVYPKNYAYSRIRHSPSSNKAGGTVFIPREVTYENTSILEKEVLGF